MEKKRVKFLIKLAVPGIIIAVILLPGYTKLQDIIARNKSLEVRIIKLTKINEALRIEKDKLENDMIYIEKVAREKLGVAKEREVIIKEKP